MRAALLGVLFLGCGKTNGAAIDELKPLYHEVRAKLARLEPLTRSLDDVEGKVAGAFDDHGDTQSTLFIVTAEQLADPDFEASGDLRGFNPVGGGALLRCLRWTGPKNPMSASALSTREGDRIKSDCEAAARPTSLVVTRTVASETPRLLEDGRFTGGRAEITVTAIDWASGAVTARFTVNGEPDPQVNYTVRGGESKAVEAARSVHSSMWVDARKKLFEGLRQRGAALQ